MKKSSKPDDIEERPDGWERFERAVDAAVKSGPKHREKPDKKSSTARPLKRERLGIKSVSKKAF